MTVVWTLPGKYRTGLGDAVAQQSANFVVEMVFGIYRHCDAELFSRGADDYLIRKRRETGDGPI
jgi:hypothetical protein